MIISPLVLTEVDHLAEVRFGSKARTAIIDFVLAQAGQSRFQIPETGLEILDTARMVQRQYAGLDLADAVNVAWRPSTGPTQCSRSTAETSARCVPSPRTNGSGCSRRPIADLPRTLHAVNILRVPGRSSLASMISRVL